jgi:PAS domain S-box-containing protein
VNSTSDTVRVLHVDDEPGFAELAAEFLERQDGRFVVETAGDASEGQDRLAAADFDCVVSDYEMPGMDGIEFLSAVREEHPDLPFILFTGKGSEDIASDAISAGVTDYLQKSPGTDQYELLANRITNAVSQVRAEHRLDEERRRFQALFENLSQAVVEVEWDGETPVVEHVNPSFTEVFGYEPDEIVGEALDEYVVPEDEADELDQLNQRIRAESGLYSEEVTRLTADGTRRFLLQTATYGDGSGTFGVYTDITERRHHEREVERQNTRLRALFENFPEPTVAYTYRDGEPYFEDVNEAFVRRFDMDAEAVTGERIDDLLVPPEDREAAQRLNDRVRAGDQIDEEVRRQTPEGIGDFRIRNISVPDDDDIDGYCVYADITEYKRRERELERQNGLFRKAQAIADVGAWEYDIVADELTWSEQVYEIHGAATGTEVTVDEAIEYYHPDDRATVRDALGNAVEAGESYDIEARIRTPAGERWVRSRGDPQTEDGSIVRVRGAIQDITDRRRQEHRLQRERDRYQSLFENNPLIIWEEDFSEAVTYLEELTSDVDDVESYLLENPDEISKLRERVEIVDVNQNAVEYYDAPSKEALIDNVEELFGDGATEAMAAEWAGIAEGQTRFRNEVVSRTLSGERHRELVDMFVPEANADDYSRVYVIGTDITEQKRRERELKRQNERLDAFASVVSHDLQGPLNVAAGRLELAGEECDSEHLDAVRDAHGRMEELIDDLLELARQGDPVGETESVDLGAVLPSCWETVATADATLRVETDRPIHADPNRLRQLFENLYRNAVEHGGSDVTVTVGELDDGFYVEDDGRGIPAEEREDVFEAGYSTTDEGTGFGLSIVGEIVEAHGWTITATEGTDGGARFEITGVSFAGE